MSNLVDKEKKVTLVIEYEFNDAAEANFAENFVERYSSVLPFTEIKPPTGKVRSIHIKYPSWIYQDSEGNFHDPDNNTMRIEQATGNLGERAMLFDLIPKPKDTLGEKLLNGFRSLWNVPEDMYADLKIAMNYAYHEGKAVGVRDTKEAVTKALNNS